MNIGYIKLHRSILDWQYWDDHNTTRLLIFFLVSVNFEPKKWKGININAGQLITSYDKISLQTGLSPSQIRRSIKILVECNELKQQTTNKFQLITLVKWGELQLEEENNNRQTTGKKHSNNNQTLGQTTTTKERKKERSKETINSINIELNKFDFKKSLIEFGFDLKLVEEWLKIRKAKKAVNTETAFRAFINEIKKSNKEPNQMLQTCVERSWSGFKAEWTINQNNNLHGTEKPNQSDQRMDALEQWGKDMASIDVTKL